MPSSTSNSGICKKVIIATNNSVNAFLTNAIEPRVARECVLFTTTTNIRIRIKKNPVIIA